MKSRYVEIPKTSEAYYVAAAWTVHHLHQKDRGIGRRDCRYFGFDVLRLSGDRIIERVSQGGGANVLLYPMSDGRKEWQTLVKLVLDVEDVEGFCRTSKDHGLVFRSIHHADSYCLANTEGPAFVHGTISLQKADNTSSPA